MHSPSIPYQDPCPKPLAEGRASLARFKTYLALQGHFWSKGDALCWDALLYRLQYPVADDNFLHAWIVHTLNTKHFRLSQVALWLMQYPAGQVVVSSRWPQAPHTLLKLLYPEWTQAQHTKNVLDLPWYNGIA